MLLTVTEAAHAAGVARSTIYDRVNAGELTRTPDKRIDVTDLLRLYPSLNMPGEGDPSEPQNEPESAPAGSDSAWLKELVESQARTIERLHGQLETAATDLRESDARAERREQVWRSQVDRLTAMLPAPANSEPELPRGFWSRLFG